MLPVSVSTEECCDKNGLDRAMKKIKSERPSVSDVVALLAHRLIRDGLRTSR